MKKLYANTLKGIVRTHLIQDSAERRYTQEKMSEHLHIVPRSYADLNNGKRLISTLTFIFYILYVCRDHAGLFRDISQYFSEIPDSELRVTPEFTQWLEAASVHPAGKAAPACPRCGEALDSAQPVCPHCGQAAKGNH